MQPEDAVKLLYQRTHGGEHLAPDRARFLARLRDEYDAIPHDPACPPTEDLGGGYVRVMLAPLPEELLPRLADAFCAMRREEGQRLRDGERMEEALALLTGLAEAGKTPFTAASLAAFLAGYDRQPLHHSAIYRAAYHPAYRVLPASALPFPDDRKPAAFPEDKILR